MTKRKRVASTGKSSSRKQANAKTALKNTDDDRGAAEDDVFIRKVKARPINERYVPEKVLGEGGGGTILLGRDLTNGKEIALKLEYHPIWPPLLRLEAYRCQEFQRFEGFPKFYWFGEHHYYNVMAFELLGPSLSDLHRFCGCRFSLRTVFMLMDQLLQRLEAVHSKGLLHRDIKPSNFLMGTGKNGNVVYLSDFGIADDANPNDDDDSTPLRPRLVGTAEFASIKAHENRRQSFKEDLESLGYSMIYFAQGELPW